MRLITQWKKIDVSIDIQRDQENVTKTDDEQSFYRVWTEWHGYNDQRWQRSSTEKLIKIRKSRWPCPRHSHYLLSKVVVIHPVVDDYWKKRRLGMAANVWGENTVKTSNEHCDESLCPHRNRRIVRRKKTWSVNRIFRVGSNGSQTLENIKSIISPVLLYVLFYNRWIVHSYTVLWRISVKTTA